MNKTTAISFVVPVRNDAGRLRRCLASITANGRPSEEIEIIVVDNGSTDASVAVARDAGARVLSRPQVGVAQLRNDGSAAACGGLIAFVDADHEVDHRWIEAAKQLFNEPGISAAGAPYDAPADANWVQRAYDGLRQHPSKTRCDVDWLPSGNLIVRKGAFEAVGGFDTGLQTCEDVDFCRRLRASGRRIVSDVRLRSVHLGDPTSLAGVFMGELWRGRDNLKASLRHPISYREVPSLVIPALDLLLLAAGVLALVTGSRTGLVVCGLALAGFASFAAIRTCVMVNRIAKANALDWVCAFAVAVVYDAARALALVAQPGHSVRRRE